MRREGVTKFRHGGCSPFAKSLADDSLFQSFFILLTITGALASRERPSHVLKLKPYECSRNRLIVELTEHIRAVTNPLIAFHPAIPIRIVYAHRCAAGVLVAYQTDMEEDINYEQPFVLVVMDYVVMVLFCFECLVLISAEGEGSPTHRGTDSFASP